MTCPVPDTDDGEDIRPLQRIRLTLRYDGTAYHGWQEQPNAVSIQATIAQILSRIEGRPVPLHGAGRTDAGVHALAQTAHFDSRRQMPPATWLRALNAQLPDDIAVVGAEAVPADFHARFSAGEKHYRYRILNHSVRCPFRHRISWFHPARLDLAAMQQAATHLIGEHDFSSFRASGCGAKTAVRTITSITIRRAGGGDTDGGGEVHADELHIDVRGSGFLKQMVRNLVGSLVAVGRGQQSPDWLLWVRQQQDRTAAAETAPARGLTLVSITYPDTGNTGSLRSKAGAR